MARKTRKVTAPQSRQPELIAVARSDVGLRMAGAAMRSLAGAKTTKAEKALKKHNCVAAPLFGPSEERVEAAVAAQAPFAMAPLENLSGFYKLSAPDADVEDLQKELLDNDLFDAVYVKPPVELPEEAVGVSGGFCFCCE